MLLLLLLIPEEKDSSARCSLFLEEASSDSRFPSKRLRGVHLTIGQLPFRSVLEFIVHKENA